MSTRTLLPHLVPADSSHLHLAAARLGIRLDTRYRPENLFQDPQAALSACADEASRRRLEDLQALVRTQFSCPGDPMSRPEDFARFIQIHYARLDQEVLGAVWTDMSPSVLDHDVLHTGTLTRAAVEPRQVLRRALELGAPGVLVFHTHPHGHPRPSQQDIDFTLRLAQGCELLGIRLLDHVIVGAGCKWISLKENGAW